MFYYYINLDRAPERREHMEHALRDKPHERIVAVDGKTWNGLGWRKCSNAREHIWRGSAGCWFSHIKALERVIEAGRFPACVLEDDVIFLDEPHFPAGGKMVYFGGLDHCGRVYGCHAIAYGSADDASKFLQFLRTHKMTSDSAAIAYNQKYGCVTYCRPWSIVQKIGYSYIHERVRKAGT